MTLITVWLAPDCWDEHFLLQNINSLKDILQIFCTLLGSLFKKPTPSAWYQMKDWLGLNNFCSYCLTPPPPPQKMGTFRMSIFEPLLSLVKSKIINKTKIIWTTTISLVFKFIWFDSLNLAISEPLSWNQSPIKSFKGQ